MSFTSVDLIAIEQAIRDLVSGERVVSVTIDGRTVSYARQDIDALLILRDTIKQEIQQIAGKKRHRKVVSGRGI